jgi:predicted DNA-binding transcriptional regulator AlpA
MSKIEVTKVCEFCGKKFTAHKMTTRFCSHQCSQRNYKTEKREQKLEKVLEGENLPSPSPTTLKKEYLSCDDVAKLMGISSTTVYRYCVTGKINCIKMNRKIFIRRVDIDALFKTNIPYQVRRVISKPVAEYYSTAEVIEKFKVSKDTVFKYAATKNIPRLKHGNKTYFSKKHIDRCFSLNTPDPDISEWYTLEEVCQKYDISVQGVHGCVSNNMVPRMRINGKVHYSKKHIDELLASRLPDPNIKEWYTMEDINNIYGFDPHYVSVLIYKNPVPKMRKGNKGYYSKEHFDELMRKKFPQPEYYTVEEAISKYSISRDALYQYIKRYNIPTHKEGKYIKISKPELDGLMNSKQKNI